MKTPLKYVVTLCAAALCGNVYAAPSADAAPADAPGHEFHHRHHRFGGGVEGAAMRNLVTQALSERTGRSAAEIQALAKEAGPRGLAEKLGLDRDAMRQIFVSAHQQLVQKSLAAGLITAEQADRLLKMPMRGPGEHGPHQ